MSSTADVDIRINSLTARLSVLDRERGEIAAQIEELRRARVAHRSAMLVDPTAVPPVNGG